MITGQHAGLDAHALRDLKFKDHDRLLELLARLTSSQQEQIEALQHKTSMLETECGELLETRYHRAMEAVKYELLARKQERRREGTDNSLGLSQSQSMDADEREHGSEDEIISLSDIIQPDPTAKRSLVGTRQL